MSSQTQRSKRCYMLPVQMIEELQRVMQETGATESELVRRAVDEHLRTHYPPRADGIGAVRGKAR